MGVEQVIVHVVEARLVTHVGQIADAGRLDDRDARAAAHLVAERRALISVQLSHRQAERVDVLDHLVERRVDEDAADERPATQRAGDQLGLRRVAAPRRTRPEDHSDGPCTGVDGELRVVESGDAADLETGRVGHRPIVSDHGCCEPGWAGSPSSVWGRAASLTRTVLRLPSRT